MQDVVKTTSPNSGGRRRRRRRNLSLYYLMIFMISAFILLVLSRTILFRINEYVVTGNQRYSKEQILSAAGLSTGKNMYGINTGRAEQRIKDALIYVENVSVKRSLPDKMIVTVEEALPFACCQYEGSRYAVISRNGRYLETEQASARTELLQVTGMELVNVAVGKSLESEDENKLRILMELFDAAEDICPGKISAIDMTDRTNIMLDYDKRILVEFGSSLDYEYKLRYISAIVEDSLEPDAEGRIIYHSAAAGASYITNEDYEAMQEDIKNRLDQAQAQDEQNNMMQE